MLELTSFQAKLLANFFSDIAKGALLSALGFPIIAQLSWNLRILSFASGLFGTIVFLSWALEIARGVSE